jgi:iron(III) transport system permease protein
VFPRTHAQRGLALLILLVLIYVVRVAMTFTIQRDLGIAHPMFATLVVAGTAGLSAVLLGGSYALLARRARARPLWLILGLSPLLIPPFLSVVAWRATLGPGGHLPRLFGWEAGGPSILMKSWIYSAPSAGFILGASWSPLVFLAVSALLLRLPQSQFEAARLARGVWGERRLLLRSLVPALLLGFGGVVALSAIEFAGPILLRVPVQAEQVYIAFDAERDSAGALQRALPLVLLAMAALALPLTSWVRPLPGARRRPSTTLRSGGAAVACALILLPGLWLPLLDLGIRLVRRSGVLATLESSWSVGAGDAGNSLWVGLWTATLAVGIGLLIAWPLRRASRAWVALVFALGAALMATPPALWGIGLLNLLNRPGLDRLLDSLACVSLADFLRFGPLAVGLLCLALRSAPLAREEAARLAGRSPWPLTLRHLAPAILTAWALVYLLSVTEFGASALLAPPGKSLLAVFVVNEAHYGQGADLAGLTSLLLVTALVPPLVAGSLAAYSWRTRGAQA